MNIVNQTATIGIRAPLIMRKQIVELSADNADLNTSVSEILLVVMEQFLMNWNQTKNESLRGLIIRRRNRLESDERNNNLEQTLT